jgi:NADH dehydrogenase/NADH:ubiquinone oxidoreductase subunit G
MSDIPLQIDGRAVAATAGMTVLDAARGAGVSIPTLCHHERLEPFGACRVCVVEAEHRGQTRLVAACTHPVEEGMVVRTRSEKVDRIRRSILEMLLAHAPDSPPLQQLAREYGADQNRFAKEASFCIHCGLCVRYCAEIKNLNAVGFVDRGTGKEISFLPEIAARECTRCKECFPLCPTSYLQAAFVLVQALAFPAGSVESPSGT